MSTNDPTSSEPHPPPPDAESEKPPIPHHKIATIFFWEVAIFLLGLVIGFFWWKYLENTNSQAHITVALLVVILCLVRYIYLLTTFRD